MTPWISNYLLLIRFATHEAVVRTWLARPGRVLAVLVLTTVVCGFTSLFFAFRLAMDSAWGSLSAAGLMGAGLFIFAFYIEPWLGPTAFQFRARHALKAQGGALHYLTHLDNLVKRQGCVCRVKIREGQCPWWLAYGIESVFEPSARADHEARRLRIFSSSASVPIASKQRL